MRLNGWQRIGVVLSVVWLLCVFGYWAAHRLDVPHQLFISRFQECDRTHDTALEKVDPQNDAQMTHLWDQRQACVADVGRAFTRDVQQANGTWSLPLTFWGVTATLAWLSMWGLFGLARWIRRGFAAQ